MINLPRRSIILVVVEDGSTQTTNSPDKGYRNHLLEEYNKLDQSILTSSDIDNYFKCPITANFFLEPVITPGGYTYEKNAIEQWVKDYNQDPLGLESLDINQLRPNNIVKSILDGLLKDSKRPASELSRGVGKRSFKDVFSAFNERLRSSSEKAMEVALTPKKLMGVGSQRFSEGQYSAGSTTIAGGAVSSVVSPVASSVIAASYFAANTSVTFADGVRTSAGISPKRYTQLAEEREKFKTNIQVVDQRGSFGTNTQAAEQIDEPEIIIKVVEQVEVSEIGIQVSEQIERPKADEKAAEQEEEDYSTHPLFRGFF